MQGTMCESHTTTNVHKYNNLAFIQLFLLTNVSSVPPK